MRCFVRPSSEIARLKDIICQGGSGKNVELATGDLLSREDCLKAA
jgi:hypothetical protein